MLSHKTEVFPSADMSSAAVGSRAGSAGGPNASSEIPLADSRLASSISGFSHFKTVSPLSRSAGPDGGRKSATVGLPHKMIG